MTSSIFIRRKVPFSLFEVDLNKAVDTRLMEISNKLGVGLTLEEMRSVKEYFAEKRRNPTDVELQTIGQTWSEHCFHKPFKGRVNFRGKEIDGLFKTYISKPFKQINPS